ncbi:MAG TPA: hypothetical protein VFT65_19910 [Candidatus Angelobacter sp.]|nr:hypothetical protein [Candidatus Angelobacter sp.]
MFGILFAGDIKFKTPSRSVSVLLGIAAVLLLAGCSSSKSSSGEGSSPASASLGTLPDPCSLITQGEVETALGAGATMKPVNNERISMRECVLKPAAPGKIDEVVVIALKADMFDATKKAMLPPNSDAKPVSGIGEDGFVGRAVGYNVRKGNKYVQVFGSAANNDAANDKATRFLAEKAVNRL